MLVVLALVIAALLVTGFAATNALQNSLLDRVDTQLQNTSREQLRRASGTDDDSRPTPPTGTRVQPTGPALLSSFFSETVDANGNGVGDLRTAEGVDQTAPKLPSLATADVKRIADRAFTVPSTGGEGHWRVLVTANSSGDGAYVSAVNLSDVDLTVSRLERTIIIVSAIVLLVLGIAGYALVRSRLRKLVQVEHTAEQIAAGDLSQRVPNADERTEVGRVATAINAMLTQIESSFEAQKQSESQARDSEARMRQFVADASHELRTPLTSIRGFAELSRQQKDGVSAAPNAMSRIESEAVRMGGLVEDLLVLARLDQQRPLESQPVDLFDIVEDAVHDAPATGPQHHVTLAVDARAKAVPMIVMGDESRLRQVMANLMMNAYTHTPAGTNIEVRLRNEGLQALIEVADDGPGMDAEDAGRIFERFYRSDPSRTRASGGSGLGLSIVSSIVAAQGGTVTVDTSPGDGAVFSLRLPLVPADED